MIPLHLPSNSLMWSPLHFCVRTNFCICLLSVIQSSDPDGAQFLRTSSLMPAVIFHPCLLIHASSRSFVGSRRLKFAVKINNKSSVSHECNNRHLWIVQSFLLENNVKYGQKILTAGMCFTHFQLLPPPISGKLPLKFLRHIPTLFHFWPFPIQWKKVSLQEGFKCLEEFDLLIVKGEPRQTYHWLFDGWWIWDSVMVTMAGTLLRRLMPGTFPRRLSTTWNNKWMRL